MQKSDGPFSLIFFSVVSNHYYSEYRNRIGNSCSKKKKKKKGCGEAAMNNVMLKTSKWVVNAKIKLLGQRKKTEAPTSYWSDSNPNWPEAKGRTETRIISSTP